MLNKYVKHDRNIISIFNANIPNKRGKVTKL